MHILELVSGLIKVMLGTLSMIVLANGFVETAIFYIFSLYTFSFVADRVIYKIVAVQKDELPTTTKKYQFGTYKKNKYLKTHYSLRSVLNLSFVVV